MADSPMTSDVYARAAEALMDWRQPSAAVIVKQCLTRAGLAIVDATAAAEGVNRQWRCFHCNELFTDARSAADHFGPDESSDPACKLKSHEDGLIGRIRVLENDVSRCRDEDCVAMRAWHSREADYSRALIQEEQKGYDRGLADGRAETAAAPAPAAADMGEIERLMSDFGSAKAQLVLSHGRASDVKRFQAAREALLSAIRTAIAAAEARALERAATYAERYQRDASFDDSMVGAQEHNANQSNIAAAIRALNKAGTP